MVCRSPQSPIKRNTTRMLPVSSMPYRPTVYTRLKVCTLRTSKAPRGLSATWPYNTGSSAGSAPGAAAGQTSPINSVATTSVLRSPERYSGPLSFTILPDIRFLTGWVHGTGLQMDTRAFVHLRLYTRACAPVLMRPCLCASCNRSVLQIFTAVQYHAACSTFYPLTTTVLS